MVTQPPTMRALERLARFDALARRVLEQRAAEAMRRLFERR